MICYATKVMLGETKMSAGKGDKCGPRPFYITEDGKYAIPQDLAKVDADDNVLPPDDKTPKYRIKILPPLKKRGQATTKAAKKVAKKVAKRGPVAKKATRK